MKFFSRHTLSYTSMATKADQWKWRQICISAVSLSQTSFYSCSIACNRLYTRDGFSARGWAGARWWYLAQSTPARTVRHVSLTHCFYLLLLLCLVISQLLSVLLQFFDVRGEVFSGLQGMKQKKKRRESVKRGRFILRGKHCGIANCLWRSNWESRVRLMENRKTRWAVNNLSTRLTAYRWTDKKSLVWKRINEEKCC